MASLLPPRPPRLVVEREPGLLRLRAVPTLRSAAPDLGQGLLLLGLAGFFILGPVPTLAANGFGAFFLLGGVLLSVSPFLGHVHELDRGTLRGTSAIQILRRRAPRTRRLGADCRVAVAPVPAGFEVQIVLADGAAASVAVVAEEIEARMLAREASLVTGVPLAAASPLGPPA